MCGIFGAVASPSVPLPSAPLLALALANQERGEDSAGAAIVDTSGRARLVKSAESVSDSLSRGAAIDRLSRALDSAPGGACVGHTRAATQGKVNARNAHPFRRGSVTLAHNGIVDSPDRSRCDSILLAQRFRDAPPGDLRAALGGVSGYWSIAWHDARDNTLRLLCGRAGLSIAWRGDCGYWSSSGEHLQRAIPDADYYLSAETGAAYACTIGSGDNWRAIDGYNPPAAALDARTKGRGRGKVASWQSWRDDDDLPGAALERRADSLARQVGYRDAWDAWINDDGAIGSFGDYCRKIVDALSLS